MLSKVENAEDDDVAADPDKPKEKPAESPVESALKQEKNEPEVKVVGPTIPPGKVLVDNKVMESLLKENEARA